MPEPPELDDGDSEELDPEELDPEELDPEELDPEELDPEELDPEELDPEELDPEELDPEELDPERTLTRRFQASQVQVRLVSQAPGLGMVVMLPVASKTGWTAPDGPEIEVISLAGLWVRPWSSAGLSTELANQLPVWSKVNVSICWRVAATTPP